MDYKTLSNGIKIPVLGYGVYQVTKDECERCVRGRRGTVRSRSGKLLPCGEVKGNEDLHGTNQRCVMMTFFHRAIFGKRYNGIPRRILIFGRIKNHS